MEPHLLHRHSFYGLLGLHECYASFNLFMAAHISYCPPWRMSNWNICIPLRVHVVSPPLSAVVTFFVSIRFYFALCVWLALLLLLLLSLLACLYLNCIKISNFFCGLFDREICCRFVGQVARLDVCAQHTVIIIVVALVRLNAMRWHAVTWLDPRMPNNDRQRRPEVFCDRQQQAPDNNNNQIKWKLDTAHIYKHTYYGALTASAVLLLLLFLLLF